MYTSELPKYRNTVYSKKALDRLDGDNLDSKMPEDGLPVRAVNTPR
jgi:hypothetical protein